MKNRANTLERIYAYLSPSLLSGTLVVLTTMAIMLMGNWSFLLSSNLIMDFLIGRGATPDLSQSSARSFHGIINLLFGNLTLNKILFFGFWMAIGLGVYMLITAAMRGLGEAKSDIDSMSYVHSKPNQLRREILLKFAIRLGTMIVGIIYASIFLRFLLPFCLYSSQITFGNLSALTGWVYLLLALIVSVCSLHAFVIILRLIAIRPRLFGDYTP